MFCSTMLPLLSAFISATFQRLLRDTFSSKLFEVSITPLGTVLTLGSAWVFVSWFCKSFTWFCKSPILALVLLTSFCVSVTWPLTLLIWLLRSWLAWFLPWFSRLLIVFWASSVFWLAAWLVASTAACCAWSTAWLAWFTASDFCCTFCASLLTTVCASLTTCCWLLTCCCAWSTAPWASLTAGSFWVATCCACFAWSSSCWACDCWPCASLNWACWSFNWALALSIVDCCFCASDWALASSESVAWLPAWIVPVACAGVTSSAWALVVPVTTAPPASPTVNKVATIQVLPDLYSFLCDLIILLCSFIITTLPWFIFIWRCFFSLNNYYSLIILQFSCNWSCIECRYKVFNVTFSWKLPT